MTHQYTSISKTRTRLPYRSRAGKGLNGLVWLLKIGWLSVFVGVPAILGLAGYGVYQHFDGKEKEARIQELSQENEALEGRIAELEALTPDAGDVGAREEAGPTGAASTAGPDIAGPDIAGSGEDVDESLSTADIAHTD